MVLTVMNTTELVVEKGPEKNSGPHRFKPMTTVILVQCSIN